jgi:hypothetical protein
MKSQVYLNIVANVVQTLFVIIATLLVLFNKVSFQNVSILSDRPRWMLVSVAVVALIAAFVVASKRSTYLPFLGYTAFPPGALNVAAAEDGGSEKKKLPTSTTAVQITLPLPEASQGALVVYWAANTNNAVYQSPTGGGTAVQPGVGLSPEVAYMNTSNVGVTSVKNGYAICALDCPAQYMVNGSQLQRHMHFRVQVKPGSGLFGPVQTLPLECRL